MEKEKDDFKGTLMKSIFKGQDKNFCIRKRNVIDPGKLKISIFEHRSSKDKQRSWVLQSTNSTFAPAFMTLKGVAMKVLEGHNTIFPFALKNSSAAKAAPPQLENATE